MKIAICDDEEVQRIFLSDHIKEWAKNRMTTLEVSCFPNGESLLFAWEDEAFDLLILDIEMGTLSGVELARKIRIENKELPILFITGYEKYMAQGYEVAVLHYLLKPVRKEKLFEALGRTLQRQKPEEKLTFPTTEGHILFPASHIWYVEAMGHDCLLCVTEDKWQVRMSMGEALKLLNGKKEFVQCHRSYLVNLQHVCAITKAEVVLDDKSRLPISRRAHKEVNEAFIRNYKYPV